MIFRLFRRSPETDSIAALYGAIVAQARSPVFYQSYAVPDTVEGRFELIVLHLVIVLYRLRSEPEQARPVAQGLFDRFCRDMDGNLREMGVGDLAVPRQMHQMAASFYGRKGAYEAAMDGSDGALAAAIARNVHGVASEQPGPEPERLAAYVRTANRSLAGQDAAALCRGEVEFPRPETVRVEDVASAELASTEGAGT